MGAAEQWTIRPITVDDVDAYRQARLRALREDPDWFSERLDDVSAQPEEFWVERVSANARHESSSTYLAWREGNVVGLVLGLWPEPATAPELRGMWVASEARRMGLGAALVDRVRRWAVDRGAESLELWVMTGNEPARRLYERCGFELKSDHRSAPDDPCRNEIRMRLPLGV